MKVTTTVDLSGFRPADAGKAVAQAIGPRTADATERLKTRLRADTRGALGQRMANTWRGEVYPVKRPTRTLNPAGLVTSNASKVVSAFDPAATIKARNATYLAIPTENVPRQGRAGKPMTPVEVEARFNQEMEIIPSLTRPGTFLLVITARRGKRGVQQIRAKTARAFWKQAERIVMFVLVKQVRMKPLLNWRQIIAAEQAAFNADIRAGVAAALQPFGGKA